ncbi:MAG: Type IV pilus biogenesis and competence protein PilQ [Burkholderia plantarii]|nr:MAG: Type IV pilus biogenesis and competence protein PilQ [Burkholderia plantarii]
MKIVTGAGQRVLSRRGSVVADPRTNLLFITDIDARLAQIAALIAQLDRPSRQVLIEARIVEGERGFSRELGARLALRA